LPAQHQWQCESRVAAVSAGRKSFVGHGKKP